MNQTEIDAKYEERIAAIAKNIPDKELVMAMIHNSAAAHACHRAAQHSGKWINNRELLSDPHYLARLAYTMFAEAERLTAMLVYREMAETSMAIFCASCGKKLESIRTTARCDCQDAEQSSSASAHHDQAMNGL